MKMENKISKPANNEYEKQHSSFCKNSCPNAGSVDEIVPYLVMKKTAPQQARRAGQHLCSSFPVYRGA